jgi:glutamate/tyrosine decarboxylase-like PLP-dependent enzyme
MTQRPIFTALSVCECAVLDPEKMRAHIDENTIGVVCMMASTYTGQYEPVQEVDRVLEEIKQVGWQQMFKHGYTGWLAGYNFCTHRVKCHMHAARAALSFSSPVQEKGWNIPIHVDAANAGKPSCVGV